MRMQTRAKREMPVRLGLTVHDRATIRVQNLSGHIRRIVRREKNITRRDFFRLAWPAEWNVRSECFDILFWKGCWDQRSPDRSRRDAIDANFPFRQRLRQRAGKGCDCALRGRVSQ